MVTSEAGHETERLEAAALRHLAAAERVAADVPGLGATAPRAVGSVGVIGAGTMGSGIAVVLAGAGLEVVLVDRAEDALSAGEDRIDRLLEREVASGRVDAGDANARRRRITPAGDHEALGRVDLVIEAVFEDLEVKRDVFRRLDGVVRDGALLATNTSYLDVDAIAAATSRPGDVLGLHFFSPAHRMRLLEVVRGRATAPDALATGLALARKIGKVAVVAEASEGFIANRIWARYRREVEYLIEEGATPEAVDAALEARGFPMGPFKTFDLAGLDIAWAWRKKRAARRDPRERYVDIADSLCERGRHGRKVGLGWYLYPVEGGGPVPDPEVGLLIEAARERRGIEARRIDPEEVWRRVFAAIVNEGARVLEEGVAARPSDVDLAAVHGWGFPPALGGPLWEADRRGLASVLDDVESVHARGGHGTEPAALLVELARAGRTFHPRQDVEGRSPEAP